MRVLITGGAGFVGSNLAIMFKENHPDASVVALDNLHRKGSELNVPRLKAKGIGFVMGDVRKREDLDALGDADVLIECSAEPSAFAGFGSSPEYLLDTNLMGAVNCLEYARKRNAEFVFLSSSRVYPIKTINELNYMENDTRFVLDEKQTPRGVSARGFTEELATEGSRTLYGTAKLAAEMLIQEYAEMYGLRSVINRCGLISGPWQMGKVDQGVIALWVARHHYGLPLSYIGFGGSGKQVRDVLHVKDLYTLLEIQLKDVRKHTGEVYNVGGGAERSVSLAELTAICQKYTGRSVPVTSVPETKAGDIRLYITDNSKVTEKTGWTPSASVEQTVRDVAEWVNEHSAQLKNVLTQV
ncbi:MAG: NAD-dependent epimerase/dehydratase family protein [Candidatus Aenigmarchaeota archaeon]|nr:NAD-dependent epimerase/dehydratase family protein [Candidatus Aenigmarchaeota archaeon]